MKVVFVFFILIVVEENFFVRGGVWWGLDDGLMIDWGCV